MNPFMALLGVLNVAAAAWYWHGGNPKMAGVTICYAVSSVLLGMV